MSIFADYLENIPAAQRETLQSVVATIQKHVPEAEEGLSYGLPAFKYQGRPLIGFSSNKYGLNIYPFDPRIISAIKPELTGYEISKGVVRFTPEKPIPDNVVLLMTDLRLEYLKSGGKMKP